MSFISLLLPPSIQNKDTFAREIGSYVYCIRWVVLEISMNLLRFNLNATIVVYES